MFLTAEADAFVEVAFQLGVAHDVTYSSDVFVVEDLSGDPFVFDFESTLFDIDNNTVLAAGIPATFSGGSFSGRLGPGNYFIRSSAEGFATSLTSGGQVVLDQSITFTAVPEPSALAFLVSMCVAATLRRNR